MTSNTKNIWVAAIFVLCSPALLRNGTYLSWMFSIVAATIAMFDRDRLPKGIRENHLSALIVSVVAAIVTIPIVFD